MNVAFVLPKIQLAGGVYIVLEHARRLARDHGFDVSVVLTRDLDVHHPFPSVDHLDCIGVEEAASRTFDIALATWWDTVYALPSLDARRYGQFVQNLEDRFYGHWETGARLRAAGPQMLPLSFVTTSNWLAAQLRAIQPGAPCFTVRSGIDKDVFRITDPRFAPSDEPLRIVVEGPPEVWFKGVPEAVAAVKMMREPRELTLVTGEFSATKETAAVADHVVDRLMHEEMAELLARSHVLLKLSRVEGMAGPPLEAFHMGATSVLTPVTGHDEYAVHGWNCALVGFDDVRGTARTLDLLARDRDHLHVLRQNAVATARAWPDWATSTGELATVLQEIAHTPPPADPRNTRQFILDLYTALPPLTGGGAAALTEDDEQSLRVGRAVRRTYHHPILAPLRFLLRPLLRRVVR